MGRKTGSSGWAGGLRGAKANGTGSLCHSIRFVPTLHKVLTHMRMQEATREFLTILENGKVVEKGKTKKEGKEKENSDCFKMAILGWGGNNFVIVDGKIVPFPHF